MGLDNEQLSYESNATLFQRGSVVGEKALNEGERTVFQSSEKSYNSQKHLYTQQAFQSGSTAQDPARENAPVPSPPSNGAYEAAKEPVVDIYQYKEQRNGGAAKGADSASGKAVNPNLVRKHVKPLWMYSPVEDFSRVVNRKGKRFNRLSARPKTVGRRLAEKEAASRLKDAAMSISLNESKQDREKRTSNVSDESLKKAGRLSFGAASAYAKGVRRLRTQPVSALLYHSQKGSIRAKKEDLLKERKEHLRSKKDFRDAKKALRQSNLSKEQKKRQKKKMVQSYKQKEGNAFTRTKNNAAFKIRKKKLQLAEIKRKMHFIAAIFGSLTFIIMLLLGGFCILAYMAMVSLEGATNMVSMNDYGTMSEGTDYLADKEAELDAYINQDRSKFEDGIEMSEGKDIDEFVYNLCDFGHDQMKLIAYLSAKYGSFTLDAIRGELDSIFKEMYTLTTKCVTTTKRRQDGTTYDYTTCYVTLTKKELEKIIDERLTDNGMRTSYEGYMLTSNGQQVYGPVIKEDWTNKISSPFGTRLHPIQKTVKHHNGVDIAIPIGTPLFSAIDGTVITAKNSGNAGNMVSVQKEDGWIVTFMHMDSFAVSAGQKVKKGQLVGRSGNTGGSTGPHLHLEVKNADGKYVNPIFIIPQKQHGL